MQGENENPQLAPKLAEVVQQPQALLSCSKDREVNLSASPLKFWFPSSALRGCQ